MRSTGRSCFVLALFAAVQVGRSKAAGVAAETAEGPAGVAAGSNSTDQTNRSASDEWAHRQAGSGRCQMILTSGYGYRQFIPLEPFVAPPWDDPMEGYPSPQRPPSLTQLDSKLDSTTDAPSNTTTGQRLLLRFQVMTESDAHILFSAQRRSDREAYEVVLGAGNNSYTDFRRLPASVPPRRAFNYSSRVVSGEELRAFWLLVDLNTGVLAVGPDGGPPILAWVDPDPVRVRYFSLCTWTDVQGTWLYGCGNNTATEPEDADGMSPIDRLVLHVLTANKRVAPYHTTPLEGHLYVDRFAMDDTNGMLSVFGTMQLEWQDERLIWSPSDFSGLNETAVSPSDVWVPHLRSNEVMQAMGLASGPGSRIVLNATGRLRCRFATVLQARCSVEDVEKYVCAADLTVLPPANVLLTVELSPSVRAPGGTGGRWECTETEWQGGVGPDSGLNVLRVALRHRGSRITCVLLASFIVCCALWVASLILPEPLPKKADGSSWPEGWHPTGGLRAVTSVTPPPPRSRTLLFALNLLVTAVALLSAQVSLPHAYLVAAPSRVMCVAAALLVASVGLVLPPLVSYSSSWLPTIPRPLSNLMMSTTLSMLLLCRFDPPERPRWRDCPNGTAPEHVLEMLDAMDAEVRRRDWWLLTLAVEKVSAVICITLVLTALGPALIHT